MCPENLVVSVPLFDFSHTLIIAMNQTYILEDLHNAITKHHSLHL